jgi:hypothetical protein
MVASPDDPFAVNPYSAPEMQEHVELDRATHARGSVWRWLVVAVVIEAALTTVMITFHSSSPRVGGINICAIGTLFLSGILACTFASFVGRRSSRPRAILIAQFGNLLIWLILGTIFHLRFGILVSLTYEGPLLLSAFVASAMLSLIVTLVSSGVVRSRATKS